MEVFGKSMIIRIDEIKTSPLELRLKFEPLEFDTLGEDSVLAAPVQVTMQLRKIGLDIDITGQIFTKLQVVCCRCLEPQVSFIQNNFHTIYRDARWMETKEEIELEAEDLLVSYYAGDTLNLVEVVREQIILAIPLQVFCKPDCAGLCPQCGQDLNFKKCACEKDKIDPRFAILSKLVQN